MGSNGHKKNLVVLQLSGGNDCLNTVIPYNDGNYVDYRPTVRVDTEKVLPLDDQLAFNPDMGAVKTLWDEGKVAVINGIGYPNPNPLIEKVKIVGNDHWEDLRPWSILLTQLHCLADFRCWRPSR